MEIKLIPIGNGYGVIFTKTIREYLGVEEGEYLEMELKNKKVILCKKQV